MSKCHCLNNVGTLVGKSIKEKCEKINFKLGKGTTSPVKSSDFFGKGTIYPIKGSLGKSGITIYDSLGTGFKLNLPCPNKFNQGKK